MSRSEARDPSRAAARFGGAPDPVDERAAGLLGSAWPGRPASRVDDALLMVRLDRLASRTSPDERARTAVRTRVLRRTGLPLREARRVALALERRLPQCETRQALAMLLEGEAGRLAGLWDDPRLPCGDDLRRTMLFSVPVLLERADRLRTSVRPDGGAAARGSGWRLALQAAARRLRVRAGCHGAPA